jgi:hypothetical protein
MFQDVANAQLRKVETRLGGHLVVTVSAKLVHTCRSETADGRPGSPKEDRTKATSEYKLVVSNYMGVPSVWLMMTEGKISHPQLSAGVALHRSELIRLRRGNTSINHFALNSHLSAQYSVSQCSATCAFEVHCRNPTLQVNYRFKPSITTRICAVQQSKLAYPG